MADATISQFRDAHKGKEGPWIVEASKVSVGGVDPLGLRQINFDLMDKVFPGLNNVARHIRPFTVVTWAWRRTVQLAKEQNVDLKLSEHQDFVARVEVAFVWSMLLGSDEDVDLPGNQRVTDLAGGGRSLTFGDSAWADFVQSRRNSTALTAAINYGPGLRALNCLYDDDRQPGVRVPYPSFEPALDAFEKKIRPMLGHKMFNGWGKCTLRAADAEKWQPYWDYRKVTKAEQQAFRERLAGGDANEDRRSGFKLLVASADNDDEQDDGEIRATMCSNSAEPGAALRWKRTQSRQAFRLALEALLEWIVREIGDGSLKTQELASRFMKVAGHANARTADAWLKAFQPNGDCPVQAVERLEETFRSGEGIESAIMSALATTLLSDPSLRDESWREDRLPVAAATADFSKMATARPEAFVGLMIERWILAQHTYWSVGRGLADARSGAKSILRLRIVQEEAGWTVTRGQGRKRMPNPTPDRLRTALSLATEAGLI